MDTILYRTDEGDGFRRGSAANPYGRERWCRPDRPAAPRCGAAARGAASRGGAAESLGRRDGSTTSQGARGGRFAQSVAERSRETSRCATARRRGGGADGTAAEAARRAAALMPRPVWHRLRPRLVGRAALAAVLGIFLIVAAFQLAAIYLDGRADGSAPLVPAVVADAPQEGEPATSTPRDQWRRGEVPFLYQIDSAWADAPYAGTDVAEAGCGPTCLSMVYVALTGKDDYDPAAMAAFSEAGGYVEDGMTAWRLMGTGAGELGLASHEVPADRSRILAELGEGRPIICSVGPGDFTTTGHFIVLAGVAEDGRVVVHDPNSPVHSAQTWDVDQIIGQARNFWAFERA
ncbi:C39 family peptidase [Adlercreutzia muris]|nr:C39 family peptidase [Adlercreutzia muris]MCR2029103.1 C39 family peptidase [Adlercreutzia muris]